MTQVQIFFIAGTIALPLLLAILHAFRTRITLGPLFGVAGVYSLMLWQLLQTGWWVSIGEIHFNTAFTIVTPPLILGFLLTVALDGIRVARAYMLMVITASVGAWLFSAFRETLAQHVPLPYLIVMSNRDHFAIILGLLFAQLGGMLTYSAIRKRAPAIALPLAEFGAVALWLTTYSLTGFSPAMGLANIHNELPAFLASTLASALILLAYGLLAQRHGMLMPDRDWNHLLALWRRTEEEKPQNAFNDAIADSDRVVSELRLLNRRLADNSQIMETHMREAAYGILILDESQRIKRANGPAEDLLNLPSLAGRQAAEVLDTRLTPPPALDALASSGEAHRYRLHDNDRERGWIELQATRLNGETTNKGYYLILKDITGIVEEERLRSVSERVRDLHQTGQVLAHDFSNLLIGAQAQLARMNSNDAEQRREAASSIETALRRGRELLLQLGAGSQFGTPRLSNLDLHKMLEEAAAIVRATAAENGVCIQLPENEGYRVNADASQMVRVFTNLIKNAVRASPTGTHIRITTQRAGHGIEIHIKDNGQGMTPTQLEMAFDPGFSTKGGGQGGLGLAISYLMTEAHGGKLELKPNTDNSGITAIVWLPEALATLPPNVDFDALARTGVIVASLDPETTAAIAQELQERGGQLIAEVCSKEELLALIEEPEEDWQTLLVASDFPLEDVRWKLPAHLTIQPLPSQPGPH